MDVFSGLGTGGKNEQRSCPKGSWGKSRMCCACALFQDENKTTWLRLYPLSGDSKFIEQKAPTKENVPQSTGDPDATSRTAAGRGVNAQGIPPLETSVWVEGGRQRRQARVELWPRKTARGKEPLFWAAAVNTKETLELWAPLQAKDKSPHFLSSKGPYRAVYFEG